MIEKFYIEKYKEILLDISLWEEKADYLYEAAELLKPYLDIEWDKLRKGDLITFHYFSLYFMLSSFAIENLLKALIIKNNNEDIKERVNKKNRLPNCLNSHDLLELSKKAGLECEETYEKQFLKKLSDNAIWEGRYPIPSGPKDYNNRIVFFNSMDYKDIENLIREIKAKLKRAR